MASSRSSLAGATATSQIACRSRKGGTTRCDPFSQDVKSSTAHGDSPSRSLWGERGGIVDGRQGQRKSLPSIASAFRHDRYEGLLPVKGLNRSRGRLAAAGGTANGIARRGVLS